jgi:hypothetical protein
VSFRASSSGRFVPIFAKLRIEGLQTSSSFSRKRTSSFSASWVMHSSWHGACMKFGLCRMLGQTMLWLPHMLQPCFTLAATEPCVCRDAKYASFADCHLQLSKSSCTLDSALCMSVYVFERNRISCTYLCLSVDQCANGFVLSFDRHLQSPNIMREVD